MSLPRLRLSSGLQTIDDSVDVRLVEGSEKGLRFLVLVQFREKILRRSSVSRRIVGGAPAASAFAISICFSPAGSSCRP
jgi:hypothetical protein